MDEKQDQQASHTGQAKPGERHKRARGQSLVEYALIASLVVLGIIAVLTVTGPAVGNVFSNTVYNMLGQTFDTQPMPNDQQIQTQARSLETLIPPQYPYSTNTPLIPTCASSKLWAPTVPGTTGGTYVPGAC